MEKRKQYHLYNLVSWRDLKVNVHEFLLFRMFCETHDFESKRIPAFIDFVIDPSQNSSVI